MNNHTTQLATIDGQVTQLNSWVQNIFTQSAQTNQDAAQALATANAFSDAIYQIQQTLISIQSSIDSLDSRVSALEP